MTVALPVAGGKIIGTPYAGTHTLGNWESDNAVDIAVPIGTPVYAVEAGTIGPQFGALGESSGRFAGLRLHLNAPAGESFYYAHLSSFAPGIRPGATVKAGDLLGYSGSANGVAHLHLGATTDVDPLALVKGLPGAIDAALAPSSSGDPAAADANNPWAIGCATLVLYGVTVVAGTALLVAQLVAALT